MAGYYDYVLALIPLSLAGIAAALLGVGWTVTAAVPVAGGVTALLVGHALFVNGPVATPEAPVESAPETPAAAPVTAD